MTSNKHLHGGLPPAHPKQPRRGSNTPISPMAAGLTQATPNRSRSLDGLLDSDQRLSSEREPETVEMSEDSSGSPSVPAKPTERNKSGNLTTVKARSMENNLDEPLDHSTKKSSMQSLHSNSSDSKRKRNFMDRCVNKVRSLIKK